MLNKKIAFLLLSNNSALNTPLMAYSNVTYVTVYITFVSLFLIFMI